MRKIGLLLVLAAWFACLTVSPARGGELCVKVTDLNMEPIAEATVVIADMPGKTLPVRIASGPDGMACRKELSEGDYRVDLWQSGYLHVTYEPVPVRREEPSRLTAVLPAGAAQGDGIRKSALCLGILQDRRGPVRQARICLFSPDFQLPQTCGDTDSQGYYAIPVAPGPYVAEIEKGTRRALPVPLALPVPGVYRNVISVAWPE